MAELSDRPQAEFLHRSYHTIDGLWFMKAEEKYGLDAALDLDNEVWKVLPKIQTRMLKSMLGDQGGISGLMECVDTKLALEGFRFEIEESLVGEGFSVRVNQCPWHDAMLKSGRESVSGKINSLVCNTEYSVCTAEFGDDLSFKQKERICTGSEACLLEFKRS